ncbi:MAG: RNA polymerase sigma factor (sigma-70 family) [Chlamydiales bacterium]
MAGSATQGGWRLQAQTTRSDRTNGTAPCWEGLERLREPLLRFLASRCRDQNEADDVIQETFVRAARYRGSLTDTRRLRSWVMRIASNVLSDRAVRSGRGPSLGLDEELCDAIEGCESFPGDGREEAWIEVGGDELDRDAVLSHLAQGLSDLRASDRSVLDTYYREGESCTVTGLRCGIEPHLVKVHLFRARRRLESLMRQRVATDRTRRLLDGMS